MKILALADEECPALWDYYVPGRLAEYDLILSCGDLKAEYLSFLVTMARAPLLYVHGNHDVNYLKAPPEGCDCADDAYVICHGIRILGLGGCRQYHEGPYQYTEAQMRRRIRRLSYVLWRNRGVDIVITHAPPRGLGDREDPAHLGFEAFRSLIEKWHPALFLHGHVHMRYEHGLPREQFYEGTRIVNVSERFVLDWPGEAVTGGNSMVWKTRQPSG